MSGQPYQLAPAQTASTEQSPQTQLRTQLVAMLIAQAELGPPLVSEFRIHPDDLRDLRREVSSFTHEKDQQQIYGLRLIEDEKAERLPRKSGAA